MTVDEADAEEPAARPAGDAAKTPRIVVWIDPTGP
jgi:hypothetical protein